MLLNPETARHRLKSLPHRRRTGSGHEEVGVDAMHGAQPGQRSARQLCALGHGHASDVGNCDTIAWSAGESREGVTLYATGVDRPLEHRPQGPVGSSAREDRRCTMRSPP